MCEILVELGGVNVLDVDDVGNDVVVSVETQVREIGDETIFQATGGLATRMARPGISATSGSSPVVTAR